MLGTNTIIELLERGYSVRGMVRRPGAIPVSMPGLEEFSGQITRQEDVAAAAEGCHIIIHIAANTSQHAQPYADYAAVNVSGTRHVLHAAERCGISRVVLVSSANTLGHGSLKDPGNEKKGMQPPFTRSAYALSKREAEEVSMQFPGEIITVNPSFLLGSYDTKPSSGKIILRGYHKKIIMVPPGGKNFIHVKDAAKAICDAARFGKDKERYLLVNENMSYRRFYKLLNQVTGNQGWIVTIPACVLLTIGVMGSTLSRMGIKTSLHYNNMRILCAKNYYSNNKAVRELNLTLTPLSTAIEDAVNWFKTSGMLAK